MEIYIEKASVCMAKPNYSFEKRSRELAKKKKKDLKRQQKEAAKASQAPKTPPSAADEGDR